MALGWGIVGIGSHPDLKVAPAMQVANGSELVAVCGRDQGRSDSRYELPPNPNAFHGSLVRPVRLPSGLKLVGTIVGG